jgi:hypothetical protein
VTVLRHDLLVDPPPAEELDLVHARLVLMHLPARVEALRRLLVPLRQGGHLAVTDVDFTSVEVAPSTPAWKRGWSALRDTLIAGGWDYTYGSRLRDDLEALELADVRVEHIVVSGQGGSTEARALALTFERVRDRMLALGAAAGDIDESVALLNDESVRVQTPTHAVATARKP